MAAIIKFRRVRDSPGAAGLTVMSNWAVNPNTAKTESARESVNQRRKAGLDQPCG
jgi:hypothetical protein